jgi:hypothetical protein
MNKATHTPSPWSVSIERDKYDSSRAVIRVRAEEHRNHPQGPLTVARVNQYLSDESVANAHLIASAPDLLSAARLANEELLALGAGSSGSPALRALWQAIARAEGKQ